MTDSTSNKKIEAARLEDAFLNAIESANADELREMLGDQYADDVEVALASERISKRLAEKNPVLAAMLAPNVTPFPLFKVSSNRLSEAGDTDETVTKTKQDTETEQSEPLPLFARWLLAVTDRVPETHLEHGIRQRHDQAHWSGRYSRMSYLRLRVTILHLYIGQALWCVTNGLYVASHPFFTTDKLRFDVLEFLSWMFGIFSWDTPEWFDFLALVWLVLGCAVIYVWLPRRVRISVDARVRSLFCSKREAGGIASDFTMVGAGKRELDPEQDKFVAAVEQTLNWTDVSRKWTQEPAERIRRRVAAVFRKAAEDLRTVDAVVTFLKILIVAVVSSVYLAITIPGLSRDPSRHSASAIIGLCVLFLMVAVLQWIENLMLRDFSHALGADGEGVVRPRGGHMLSTILGKWRKPSRDR